MKNRWLTHRQGVGLAIVVVLCLAAGAGCDKATPGSPPAPTSTTDEDAGLDTIFKGVEERFADFARRINAGEYEDNPREFGRIASDILWAKRVGQKQAFDIAFPNVTQESDDLKKKLEQRWYDLVTDDKFLDSATRHIEDFEEYEKALARFKSTLTQEERTHLEFLDKNSDVALPPEIVQVYDDIQRIADTGWFDLTEAKVQYLRDNPQFVEDVYPLLKRYGYSEMTTQAWDNEVKNKADQEKDDADFLAGKLPVEEWAERTSQRAANAAIYREAVYDGLDQQVGRPFGQDIAALLDAYFAEQQANKDRNAGFIKWEEMERWESANPEATQAFESRPITGLTPMAIELRQAKRDLSASGYYDLDDQAWKWLGMTEYESFEDFESSYIRERTAEIEADGIDRQTASVMAASEFENHPVNDVLSELKNQGLEWTWMMENSRAAYKAWRLGILDLSLEQQYWIVDMARTGQLR